MFKNGPINIVLFIKYNYNLIIHNVINVSLIHANSDNISVPFVST